MCLLTFYLSPFPFFARQQSLFLIPFSGIRPPVFPPLPRLDAMVAVFALFLSISLGASFVCFFYGLFLSFPATAALFPYWTFFFFSVYRSFTTPDPCKDIRPTNRLPSFPPKSAVCFSSDLVADFFARDVLRPC